MKQIITLTAVLLITSLGWAKEIAEPNCIAICAFLTGERALSPGLIKNDHYLKLDQHWGVNFITGESYTAIRNSCPGYLLSDYEEVVQLDSQITWGGQDISPGWYLKNPVKLERDTCLSPADSIHLKTLTELK